MRCCCRNPNHEAVGSRADSSAPKANRMGDRGFEDDKAALQKWREQHTSPHHDDNRAEDNGATDTGKPESGSSDSDSSNTYHVEGNRPDSPVKLSLGAVKKWQQSESPKRQSPAMKSSPQNTRKSQNRPSLKEELRSPFEVSSGSSNGEEVPSKQPSRQQQSALNKADDSKPHHQQPETLTRRSSPRSQNIFRTALLDGEEEAAAVITPDTSPSTLPTSTAPAPSTPSARLQKEHHKLDALIRESSNPSNPSNNPLPPPSSPPKKSSLLLPRTPRQHDHEGLRDQLIRDVVLQQQASAGSSEQDDDDDDERIQGQVFLRVHPGDIISPRSSLDDTDDNVSDIFSDPAMEQVAHSLANDSESRERYILACRLLRARITQPNPPPILPMERELLQDLQARFQSSRTGGSAVAFEALSKLLDEADQDDDVGIVALRDSRSSSSGRRPRPPPTRYEDEDLNISQDVSMEGEITVASIREEEEGFNTVLRHHTITTEQQQQVSWKDEKNAKAMPQLLEEEDNDDDKLPEPPTKKTMVRLDGWNSSVREEQPYEIMGLDQDTPPETRVLTPALMEALRGFFPYGVSEDNFWLKFSLVRDGSSLRTLVRNVMASQHTIVCVETKGGEVFGSFCSTPWRNTAEQQKWFGTGEAFLWKAKQSRYVPENVSTINNEMEVYPFTGHDDMVQYCTSTTLAVGGGSWKDVLCPYPGEPHGIGLLLDGDLEGGETNSCATFSNPRLCGRGTSSNEFTIQNCEVWTLTPMNTIHAAEQLERQKYFIKEHAETGFPSPMRPDASPRRARPPFSPRSTPR